MAKLTLQEVRRISKETGRSFEDILAVHKQTDASASELIKAFREQRSAAPARPHRPTNRPTKTAAALLDEATVLTQRNLAAANAALAAEQAEEARISEQVRSETFPWERN